jgi:hypothetical protein
MLQSEEELETTVPNGTTFAEVLYDVLILWFITPAQEQMLLGMLRVKYRVSPVISGACSSDGSCKLGQAEGEAHVRTLEPGPRIVRARGFRAVLNADGWPQAADRRPVCA